MLDSHTEKWSQNSRNTQHLVYVSVVLPFQIADAAKSSSEVDELFIDDTGSGGYYPEDDDDFNSGSGSGKSLVTVAFNWVDTHREAGKQSLLYTVSFTQNRHVCLTTGGWPKQSRL